MRWMFVLFLLLSVSGVMAQSTDTPTATDTPTPTASMTSTPTITPTATSTPTPELATSWQVAGQDVQYVYIVDVDDIASILLMAAILVLLWGFFIVISRRL